MKIGWYLNKLLLRIRAYGAIAYISSLSRTAFTGSLVMNGLLVGLNIWIIKQLYAATYAASQVRQIGGLDLSHVVWLLAFVQSFERATWPNPIITIDEDIKSGAISYSLQRPYSYMLYHLFGFFGRIMATLIGNLFFACLAALLLVGPFSVSLYGFLAGFVALILGYILDFCMFFMFGLMGFWVEEIKPFAWLYNKIKLVFGGVILPIAFFPEYVQRVVLLLPFCNLYYTASRIIVHFEASLFFRCLCVQLCWIMILGGCTLFIFSKAVKHVSVNGG